MGEPKAHLWFSWALERVQERLMITRYSMKQVGTLTPGGTSWNNRLHRENQNTVPKMQWTLVHKTISASLQVSREHRWESENPSSTASIRLCRTHMHVHIYTHMCTHMHTQIYTHTFPGTQIILERMGDRR